MYRVIRNDTRLSRDTRFFSLRLKEIDDIFNDQSIQRFQKISEDGLVRTMTFIAPSEQNWNNFVNHETFKTKFIVPQNEYNLANNIVYDIVLHETF